MASDNNHNPRLLAAKVLDEGPYKHDNFDYDTPTCWHKCEKCGIEYCSDYGENREGCPIPDLPTDEHGRPLPLEVLAFRCRDASFKPDWIKALREILEVKDGYSCGEWAAVTLSTPADRIEAAAKAKGIA